MEFLKSLGTITDLYIHILDRQINCMFNLGKFIPENEVEGPTILIWQWAVRWFKMNVEVLKKGLKLFFAKITFIFYFLFYLFLLIYSFIYFIFLFFGTFWGLFWTFLRLFLRLFLGLLTFWGLFWDFFLTFRLFGGLFGGLFDFWGLFDFLEGLFGTFLGTFTDFFLTCLGIFWDFFGISLGLFCVLLFWLFGDFFGFFDSFLTFSGLFFDFFEKKFIKFLNFFRTFLGIQ